MAVAVGTLRRLAVDSLTSAGDGLLAAGTDVHGAHDRYNVGVLAPLAAGEGWTGAGLGSATTEVTRVHAGMEAISPALFDGASVLWRWTSELADAQARLRHLDRAAAEHGFVIHDDGTVRASDTGDDDDGVKASLQARVSRLLVSATDADDACARSLRALTDGLTAAGSFGWLQDALGEALKATAGSLGDSLRGLGEALDETLLDPLGETLDVLLDHGVGIAVSSTVESVGEAAAAALEGVGLVAAGVAVRAATKSAAEAVEKSLDKAGDAVEHALDKAGDATEDALEKAGDAAEDFVFGIGLDAESNPRNIHLTDKRRTHILDGDERGGGHRSGTGTPKKTEFPPDWSDQKIVNLARDVAMHPDSVEEQDDGRKKYVGVREGVEVVVVTEPDGEVVTSFPKHGPGVVKNNKHGIPHPKP